jgi:hypothetical protein
LIFHSVIVLKLVVVLEAGWVEQTLHLFLTSSAKKGFELGIISPGR